MQTKDLMGDTNLSFPVRWLRRMMILSLQTEYIQGPSVWLCSFAIMASPEYDIIFAGGLSRLSHEMFMTNEASSYRGNRSVYYRRQIARCRSFSQDSRGRERPSLARCAVPLPAVPIHWKPGSNEQDRHLQCWKAHPRTERSFTHRPLWSHHRWRVRGQL